MSSLVPAVAACALSLRESLLKGWRDALLKYPRPPVVHSVEMITFLAWLLLFALCWPLALFALLLYPVVWLLLLPFRVVGIAVDGVLDLLRAVLSLPARLLGGRPRAVRR